MIKTVDVTPQPETDAQPPVSKLPAGLLHPPLSLDLLHSPHAAQMSQAGVHNSSKVKIQVTALGDTFGQSGMEMSRAAVSKVSAGG